MIRVLTIVLILAAAPLRATDFAPLREDRLIMGQLLAAAVGDEIRRNCPEISARMFVVWRQALALERRARALGFSDEEIQRFVNARDEQARLMALRDAYLAEHSVKQGDQDSYCTLGHKEIAAKSPIGLLLRSR